MLGRRGKGKVIFCFNNFNILEQLFFFWLVCNNFFLHNGFHIKLDGICGAESQFEDSCPFTAVLQHLSPQRLCFLPLVLE